MGRGEKWCRSCVERSGVIFGIFGVLAGDVRQTLFDLRDLRSSTVPTNPLLQDTPPSVLFQCLENGHHHQEEEHSLNFIQLQIQRRLLEFDESSKLPKEVK